MDQELFNPQSSSVTSSRILYTPSTFARTSLLHLQEVGSLQAIHPHTSTRTNLTSFLCFVVLSGNGTLSSFTTILTDLYSLTSSSDYIRDMRINESLSALLTLLMEQSWHPESKTVSRKRLELVEIKNYLDEHYTERIVLDDLAERYYINKYYLTKIFKETYGSTINSYVIAKRITRAKQLLRFTDMTVDEIGSAVGMGDANYFSRTFRKVEGISPREYRKQW